MKHRLKLYEPLAPVDEFGSEPTEYELTTVAHAERVKQSGRMSEQVGELFADSTAVFNIRDGHRVATGWRAEQVRGYLYTVVAISHNIDRGMLTLQCERVNE